VEQSALPPANSLIGVGLFITDTPFSPRNRHRLSSLSFLVSAAPPGG
jgi:hypothetical protein